MSIISDALKKVQSKHTDEGNDHVFLEESISSVLSKKERVLPKKQPRKKGRLFVNVIILLIVASAISLSVLAFNYSGFTPAKMPELTLTKQIAQRTSQNNVSSLKPRPVVRKKKMKSNNNLPTLSGIMYSPTSPQAILNDELVSIGDEVDGFTVTAIYSSKVVISSGKKTFELKLR